MTFDDEKLDALIRKDLDEGSRDWRAAEGPPDLGRAPALLRHVPALAAAGVGLLAVLALGVSAFGLTSGWANAPLVGGLFSAHHPSPSPSASNSLVPSPQGSSAVGTLPVSPPPTCGPSTERPCPVTSPGCSTSAKCVTSSPPQASSPPPTTAECPSLSVTTDASTYSQGTLVHISATMRNNSARPCGAYVDNSSGSLACNPSAQIRDSADMPVWYSRNPKIMAPCSLGTQTVLNPGQSITKEWTWNQQCGNGARCPAGTYHVQVRWDQRQATSYFRIS